MRTSPWYTTLLSSPISLELGGLDKPSKPLPPSYTLASSQRFGGLVKTSMSSEELESAMGILTDSEKYQYLIGHFKPVDYCLSTGTGCCLSLQPSSIFSCRLQTQPISNAFLYVKFVVASIHRWMKSSFSPHTRWTRNMTLSVASKLLRHALQLTVLWSECGICTCTQFQTAWDWSTGSMHPPIQQRTSLFVLQQ